MAKKRNKSHATKQKSMGKVTRQKINRAGQVSLNVSPLANQYGGIVGNG